MDTLGEITAAAEADHTSRSKRLSIALLNTLAAHVGHKHPSVLARLASVSSVQLLRTT